MEDLSHHGIGAVLMRSSPRAFYIDFDIDRSSLFILVMVLSNHIRLSCESCMKT